MAIRKTPEPVFPMHAAGLSAVAASLSGSIPPPLGTLMEMAGAFDVLYRHHPHYRRFQDRPVPRKPRKPRPGAKPVKKPRIKPTTPIGFLATRIDLANAPPVTVSGTGFTAELWARGQLDVFSNVATDHPATLAATDAQAVAHTFELTALSAGVVTFSGDDREVRAVHADVFGSQILLNPEGELSPFERCVGPMLIRGRIGWTGEITVSRNGRKTGPKTVSSWTWRELIDLTYAVRSAPVMILVVNPT